MKIKKLPGFFLLAILSVNCGLTVYSEETENIEMIDSSADFAEDSELTEIMDYSTLLSDGVYEPDQFEFSFSGGTGRVNITCNKVEVKDGKSYAEIVFTRSKKQGGKSSYDAVRANGQVYTGEGTFTIPVQLNKNNTIEGRTVAMSSPHWIEYTIFISISEPQEEQGDSENGLLNGHELEICYTDKVKIFSYDKGYYLIEIDTAKGTFRESEEYKEYIESQKNDKDDLAIREENYSEGNMREEVSAEEGDSAAATVEESISGQIAALYTDTVIKYLVIPEGEEAPAGLEKKVILIRQPSSQVYISSKSALRIMCGLSQQERIDSVGIEETELMEKDYENVIQAMNLPQEDERYIAWGGSYDDWELRTLLLRKTDLMIETADILPRQMETLEEEMDNYLRLAQRSAQMGAAMFLDRSGDEENELARAEWYKVYGILFNCQEQAQQEYEAVVSDVSMQNK